MTETLSGGGAFRPAAVERWKKGGAEWKSSTSSLSAEDIAGRKNGMTISWKVGVVVL
jgi:hypothetical protein